MLGRCSSKGLLRAVVREVRGDRDGLDDPTGSPNVWRDVGTVGEGIERLTFDGSGPDGLATERAQDPFRELVTGA